MDKSWRDGLAFLALVRKFRPDLVDMDQARKATPRENLELAFDLAMRYLNVK